MLKREVSNFTSWIILIAMFIILSLYMYLVIQSNVKHESIMSNFLPRISKNELESYLNDNPEVIIYYAPANTLNNKNTEELFIEYLEDVELKTDIIFLDFSTYSEFDYEKLESIKGNIDIDFKNLMKQENIFIIKERTIEDVLYKNKHKIKIKDIKKFLNRYEVEQ